MKADVRPQVILASKSPSRLKILQTAGLDPTAIVSDVDESVVTGLSPADTALVLAKMKAEAVAATLNPDSLTIVIGCDSLLDFDGQAIGKPGSFEKAVETWQLIRARMGVLRTGHQVIVTGDGNTRSAAGVGSTEVYFADLTDDEIAAYAASGEPIHVAGAFTIDGLGGPYVRKIVGDPHNVIGLSLPLLRELLAELDISWHQLWQV